ncbi:hypothetical protein C8R47DRAFT_1068683 [Mycena vitilis]|nr:hypothetical protein C8R47DRAFT_1068683 [Mycena vitilis]
MAFEEYVPAGNIGMSLHGLDGARMPRVFIDSMVWRGNTIGWSPICDALPEWLQPRHSRMLAVYQPAALPDGFDTKSKSERRQEILIDLAIGLGLLVLQIPLQYIVQGHRYKIFEDVGCLSETFETPLAIVLFHLPPIFVDAYRPAIVFSPSDPSTAHGRKNINLNVYIPAPHVPCVNAFVHHHSALQWVLCINVVVVGLSRWVSWADTHSNFSRVVQIPGNIWRADFYSVASLETTRWSTLACALVFFRYFSFADEAIKNYRGAFWSVASASSKYRITSRNTRQKSIYGSSISTSIGVDALNKEMNVSQQSLSELDSDIPSLARLFHALALPEPVHAQVQRTKVVTQGFRSPRNAADIV